MKKYNLNNAIECRDFFDNLTNEDGFKLEIQFKGIRGKKGIALLTDMEAISYAHEFYESLYGKDVDKTNASSVVDTKKRIGMPKVSNEVMSYARKFFESFLK